MVDGMIHAHGCQEHWNRNDYSQVQSQFVTRSGTIIIVVLAKFTYEQYTTINQLNAGRFDPRVFVLCLQVSL